MELITQKQKILVSETKIFCFRTTIFIRMLSLLKENSKHNHKTIKT